LSSGAESRSTGASGNESTLKTHSPLKVKSEARQPYLTVVITWRWNREACKKQNRELNALE